MFCTQCGAAVSSEHKFCTGCGSRVAVEPAGAKLSSNAVVEPAETTTVKPEAPQLVRTFGFTQAQWIEGISTICAFVIVVGLLGWFMGWFKGLPAIYNCGEPIVIEACSASDSGGYPNCRIRNIADVQLGEIDAWAYDKRGTRLGSPLGQGDLDGLPPGRTVNTRVVPNATSSEIDTIVLCSVDPESTVGAGRFGIGQSPLTH